MLIRFRVQNFLSFKEEVEFSMVAGKVQKHPDHIIQIPGNFGLNVLRGAMMYGANASGKSNFVKAINFAKFMVTEGVRPKASIPRKYFKLEQIYNMQPSRFEFEIKCNEKIYEYGFSLDSKRIHEEWLTLIRPTSEKSLFRRSTNSDDENIIEFGISLPKQEKELLNYIAHGTPVNRLFLQEAIERNIKYFEEIYKWFAEKLVVIYPNSSSLLDNLGFGSELDFGNFLVKYLELLGTGVCGYTLQEILNNSNEIPPNVITMIEQELKDGDMSTIFGPDKKRYYATKTKEELKINKLLLRHKSVTCDSDVPFEMDEESDGTLRLLDLIPMLYPGNIDQNSVVIIDELDRSLHPNLSYEFVSTYLQKSNSRQLIVTTHEASLLDLNLIRRDEVWFVEKNEFGASTLYSLEEFSPRYDNDVRKGYVLGRFGAIPMINKPSLFNEE